MNDWFDAEQHVERAHELYEAGRWDEAESALRDAIALNPYQPEWQFNLGLTLEAAGKHDDAVRAFKLANELRPDDPQSLLMIGSNLLRSGKPAEALPWLEQAEKKAEEGDAQAAVCRVEALTQLGRHDDAEEAFYVAQQIDTENADLYVAMADSLLERGRHEKAVWCLREAARLDSDLAGVNARLAEAYAATGRHERARQLYLLELRRDPGDIDTLLDLGDLLVEMSRFVEAGEKFRRVLEIAPDNVDAHFAIGDLTARGGDRVAAAAAYDVVVRLDPGYPEARARLAELLLDDSRPGSEARVRTLLREEKRVLMKEIDREREAILARGSLGDDLRGRVSELAGLLLDAKLPGDAHALLLPALEIEQSWAEGLHLDSVSLLETGRTAEGMNQAREALRLDGRMTAAMHNLALANLRLGRARRARYWAAQAHRVNPDDPAVRRMRVRLWFAASAAAAALIGRGFRRLMGRQR